MGGGKGSGKSEAAARKIFYRCQVEGGHRALILRKVSKTNRDSTLEVMKRLLEEQEVNYEHDRTHMEIRFNSPDGVPNVLLFRGLDDKQKIKSIKGITMEWLEEATEFTEADFLEVDLAFREPTPYYKQIIMTFNPVESLAPWIKKRFFPDDPKDRDPRAYTDISTIEDNPIEEMRVQYAAALDAIQDVTMRMIYRYGVWAKLKGMIYSWTTVPRPPENPDEIFYGLDFGYSVNPAALVRVYRKANEFYLEELIYKTKMNNMDIGAEMRRLKISPLAYIYADAAEPKSIDEIKRQGFNIRPAPKGQDSVRAGIDFLQSQKIFIIEGSSNIIKEVSTYKWKEDRNGEPIPEPVKFNDHCFVAGTMIETQRGPVPIELVTTDDSAMTREGYRKIVAAGMTNSLIDVMTAHFSDGSTLTGTPNHPIWIRGRGFVRLDTTRYGDIIETWKTSESFTKTSRPVFVLRVDLELKKHPVYNLSVSETPEYYANGILVHNCLDGARYGIFTHMKAAIAFFGTISEDINPL